MNNMSNQKRIDLVNYAFLAAIILPLLLTVLLYFCEPAVKLFSNLYVNLMVSQMMVLLPFVWYFTKDGQSFNEAVGLKKTGFVTVILVIIFGFLIRPVANLFSGLGSLIAPSDPVTDVMITLYKTVSFPVAVLLVAALPAVVEEIVFRGAIYRTYRAGSPWKAVLLSAFLFGLMHGNVSQFSYTFVLGIVFALLDEATGTIVSSMIVHFLFNFSSVCTVYFIPKAYDIMQGLLSTMSEEELVLYGDIAEIFPAGMTGDEFFEMMMTGSEGVKLTLGDVIVTYLPGALIFGTLAIILFKAISNREGKWNYYTSVFFGLSNGTVSATPKNVYGEEKETEVDGAVGDPTVKFVTGALFAAIVLQVLYVFVTETLERLLPFLN